ncbi:MAG: putative modification/repair radical protein [Akkermansiaceae bacterium]|nr:putative modification/repair radical protein [Akkermansiaceae bacterium]
MRHYGFDVGEILPSDAPNLDLRIDPKLAWALRNRQEFPMNVQTAPRARLVRVPGLGVRNVDRLLQIRRHTFVRLADLTRLRVSLKKVMPFLITADHFPASGLLDGDRLLARLAPRPQQMELFAL